MPVNHFFQSVPGIYNAEQGLVEDLLQECIQCFGQDIYYIARESESSDIDLIYGEDPSRKFEKVYKLDVYMMNIDDHMGGGDFFSKMGLQINERSNMVVSRKTFKQYVPDDVAIRPREGDLIYVPLLTNLYEIKYVRHDSNFYALGRDVHLPYVYEMRCELFQFNNEKINTGVDEIDDVEQEGSYTIEFDMASGNSHYIIGERVFQGDNVAYATATARVIDWQPNTQKLSVIDITGTFANNANITGETSGNQIILGTFNPLADKLDYDMRDNALLANGANTNIVRTERNPFGYT
jgi:hypothetical protein